MDFKAEFDALGENRYASDMTSVATLILCTHASIISLYYWLNFDPTRLLAAKIPGYDAKPTGAAAMAAAIGYMMHETLARMHPTVSLSEQIALEDQGRMSGENLATETFRTSDVTTEQLHQDAQDVRETFKTGGAWFGAFIMLIVSLKLIGLSIVKKRDIFTPHKESCFSCGRCYP